MSGDDKPLWCLQWNISNRDRPAEAWWWWENVLEVWESSVTGGQSKRKYFYGYSYCFIFERFGHGERTDASLTDVVANQTIVLKRKGCVSVLQAIM